MKKIETEYAARPPGPTAAVRAARASLMNPAHCLPAGLLLLLFLPAAGALAQQADAIELALPATGASAPLSALARQAPALTPAGSPKAFPARTVPPHMRARRMPVSAAHGAAPYSAMPSGPARLAPPHVHTGGTVLNFEGIASDAGAPSHATGAVGETEYIQRVDSRLAIYRKSDGVILLGPIGGNIVFGGFGDSAGATACSEGDHAESIAQYDKLAQRWILSQVGWAPGTERTGPYYQCIAVSTSSAALGSYYRYVLDMRTGPDTIVFNDDAKLGVWPDAYYFTFVLFSSGDGGGYQGPRVCGFERAAMLAGARATVRCRDLGPAFGPVLPSDLDGATAPPPGSPNFLLSMDFTADGRGDHLLLWRFSFAANTLSGPVEVPVAPFTIACPASFGGPCIRQPAPGEPLDARGDRLMLRLAYRNFGDREAMVVNHSVQQDGAPRDGPVGLRWYEIRDPNGTVSVYQQGTHAPDANSRWMGSIAMDKKGNIALGYSVAGEATHPGIRYTGRLRSDAPGRLQAEDVIINGSGFQIGTSRRWGDDSTLALDPGNDCTFWYTQQYIATTGRFTWRSRIANFQFLNCE